MLATNMSGTILIRENTLLPAGLAIESEAFLPGWRVVKDLDGDSLARSIEAANWNFFYLAGEMRAAVLGRDRSGTLHRAVKRLLAKEERQFNSLEITKVVSKRFLGIPFMRVVAHTRHIQQGICLVPAKGFISGMAVPTAQERRPNSGREQGYAEVITKPHAALISSS
jgi:hypothetical protein